MTLAMIFSPGLWEMVLRGMIIFQLICEAILSVPGSPGDSADAGISHAVRKSADLEAQNNESSGST